MSGSKAYLRTKIYLCPSPAATPRIEIFLRDGTNCKRAMAGDAPESIPSCRCVFFPHMARLSSPPCLISTRVWCEPAAIEVTSCVSSNLPEDGLTYFIGTRLSKCALDVRLCPSCPNLLLPSAKAVPDPATRMIPCCAPHAIFVTDCKREGCNSRHAFAAPINCHILI